MRLSVTPLQETSKYRPDIDGLRAIAVLSVLFFHVGLGPFKGGYVGVDIFFVISGYLITRLISDEIKAGTFSFRKFYVRRIRRLFPALFVTLAVTFALSAVMLYPWHLESAGGSLVYAILSVSNFFFWSQSGYFDTDADLKPFLHTWSLSVEEQFYLIWPLLLLILITKCRRHAATVFTVAVGVASLWLAEYWLKRDVAAAFYLAPARVFEFALGAILIWLSPARGWCGGSGNNRFLEALNIAGLMLIAYAITQFDRNTSFPGINALIPCAGAALVIYAGRAPLTGMLLRNRLSVGIGLISYSLYLVHWPILVLYKYLTFNELRYVERAGVVMASILLAALMYHFIEKPFRYGVLDRFRLSPSRQPVVLVSCVMLLIVPGSLSHAHKGWEWRFSKEARDIVSSLEVKRDEWQKNSRSEAANSPFSDNPAMRKLLIVGDSHSVDFYNAVHLSFVGNKIEDVEYRRMAMDEACLVLINNADAPTTMRPQDEDACRSSIQKFFDGNLLAKADHVVYSTRWTWESLKWLPQFIEKFKGATAAQLVLLGRTAEFSDVPSLVMRFGRLDGLGEFVARNRVLETDRVNADLTALAKKYDVKYMEKIGYICSKDRTSCDVIDQNHNLLIFDYGHWTLDGAGYYGDRMLKGGFFSAMLDDGPMTSSIAQLR